MGAMGAMAADVSQPSDLKDYCPMSRSLSVSCRSSRPLSARCTCHLPASRTSLPVPFDFP